MIPMYSPFEPHNLLLRRNVNGLILLSIVGRLSECKSFKNYSFSYDFMRLAHNRILKPTGMVLW